MLQVARNLTDAFDGFLLGKRYLLLDRDSKYTEEFRQLLSDSGTKTAIADSKSQLERVRGAVRAIDQVRMPGPDDLLHLRVAATRPFGLRESLS